MTVILKRKPHVVKPTAEFSGEPLTAAKKPTPEEKLLSIYKGIEKRRSIKISEANVFLNYARKDPASFFRAMDPRRVESFLRFLEPKQVETFARYISHRIREVIEILGKNSGCLVSGSDMNVEAFAKGIKHNARLLGLVLRDEKFDSFLSALKGRAYAFRNALGSDYVFFSAGLKKGGFERYAFAFDRTP